MGYMKEKYIEEMERMSQSEDYDFEYEQWLQEEKNKEIKNASE